MNNPVPKAGALPGCATPRLKVLYDFNVLQAAQLAESLNATALAPSRLDGIQSA